VEDEQAFVAVDHIQEAVLDNQVCGQPVEQEGLAHLPRGGRVGDVVHDQPRAMRCKEQVILHSKGGDAAAVLRNWHEG
jgi:hypothetical protein